MNSAGRVLPTGSDFAVIGAVSNQSLKGQQLDDTMQRIKYANPNIIGITLVNAEGRRTLYR